LREALTPFHQPECICCEKEGQTNVLLSERVIRSVSSAVSVVSKLYYRQF